MAHDTRTFSKASGIEVHSDGRQPQLVVVLERGRPLAGGARYSLANISHVTIGRGASRGAQRVVRDGVPTLVVTIPDSRISTRHAELRATEASWAFQDCGSTNGSRVDDTRADSSMLRDGALLVLGDTFFRFRAAMPTPVTAAGDVDLADLVGLQAAFGTLLPSIARDLDRIARMAKSDISILLLGETGTGKEVLARALHETSGRRGAFVPVNCGALPPPLVESLLFGHKKGAFSGATQDEPGFVRASTGGTLFLDEIGDLQKVSQATLLRVLQEREVVPVGATRPIPVELRVIAATHKPLGELAQSGEFRSDLLARINAFTYELPPLRDRLDDLGNLVAAILRKAVAATGAPVSLSADAVQALLAHDWPLNVRELEQELRVGGLLAEGGRIDLAKLTRARPSKNGAEDPAAPARFTDAELELRQKLTSLLALHGGNVTHVGNATGKARSQIQRWLRRFGLDPKQFRP